MPRVLGFSPDYQVSNLLIVLMAGLKPNVPSDAKSPSLFKRLRLFVLDGFMVGADDVTANYTSWANSSNEGCGFGAWSLNSAGNAGFFLGDPSAAGITMTNPSFGLYANTTNTDYANADRAFVVPLAIGSTLSVDWGVNWDADGAGNKGINLYTGGIRRYSSDQY